MKDYTIVLPTPGATFQNCTSTIFVVKTVIIQSFRAAERVEFTFGTPAQLDGKVSLTDL